jgi:hypothetical protein
MANATAYSDLYTKQVAALTNYAANALTTREATPGFKLVHLTYTVTADDDDADVIKWFKIPKGSIVFPGLSKLAAASALATTAFTFGVGDDGGGTNSGAVAADAARYMVSADYKAAVTTVPTAFTGGTAAVTPFVCTAETIIQSTLGTVTLPLAGAVLHLWLAYTDGT